MALHQAPPVRRGTAHVGSHMRQGYRSARPSPSLALWRDGCGIEAGCMQQGLIRGNRRLSSMCCALDRQSSNTRKGATRPARCVGGVLEPVQGAWQAAGERALWEVAHGNALHGRQAWQARHHLGRHHGLRRDHHALHGCVRDHAWHGHHPRVVHSKGHLQARTSRLRQATRWSW